MILETVVGQARMCGFSASWLGAPTRQTAFCKEKVVPQEGRGRQGAEKLCSLACSSVIFQAKLLTKEIRNVFMHLSIQESGLLPFPG